MINGKIMGKDLMEAEKQKTKFILQETPNMIAYGNLVDEEVEIVLKPTCNPFVRNMWEKLNQPIRRVCE